MPKDYTIEQVNPMMDKETNQQRTDKYGNLRYYVKFQGEADSIPLSAKVPPQVGGTKYGSIETGEYGKYFKSAQNPNGGFGGGRKFDGDGQKQGMSIKAAAEYVTKFADKKLAPDELANAIEAYATAIYRIELKKEEKKVNAPAWEAARETFKAAGGQSNNDDTPPVEAYESLTDLPGALTAEEMAAIPF